MGPRKGYVLAIVTAGVLGFARPAPAQITPIGDVTGTVTQGKKTGTLEGTFTVNRFRTVDDKLVADGRLTGVVTFDDGKTRDIKNAKLSLPVNLDQSGIGGSGPQPLSFRKEVQLEELQPQESVSNELQPGPIQCDVLNLVLGPLDLNLLGLEIHLDTVVLDIVADPAGGLLGSLLAILCGLNLTDILGMLLGNLDLLALILNLITIFG